MNGKKVSALAGVEGSNHSHHTPKGRASRFSVRPSKAELVSV
jgi:hypothetical protein